MKEFEAGFSILHIFDLLTGSLLVIHEVPEDQKVKRMTKPEHKFFPKQVRVRQDGHVFYFGKLYSVGPRSICRKVDVLMVDDQILIKFEGEILEVHESIHGTKIKFVTKPEHMGPWFEAQHFDSYFRRKGRQFGESVDQFILNLIKNSPGVVPSSKLSCILKSGKEFGPENLDAACGKQIEGGDFLIRSLRRELGG